MDGGLSSDPENDVLTYTWHIAGEAQPRTGETVSISELSPETYTVDLEVSDGENNSFDTLVFGVPVCGPEELLTVKDSTLMNGAKNQNEGANRRLRVGSSGKNRVVTGFDLSSLDISSIWSDLELPRRLHH